MHQFWSRDSREILQKKHFSQLAEMENVFINKNNSRKANGNRFFWINNDIAVPALVSSPVDKGYVVCCNSAQTEIS